MDMLPPSPPPEEDQWPQVGSAGFDYYLNTTLPMYSQLHRLYDSIWDVGEGQWQCLPIPTFYEALVLLPHCSHGHIPHMVPWHSEFHQSTRSISYHVPQLLSWLQMYLLYHDVAIIVHVPEISFLDVVLSLGYTWGKLVPTEGTSSSVMCSIQYSHRNSLPSTLFHRSKSLSCGPMIENSNCH